MWWTMKPISSRWPASMIFIGASGFRTAGDVAADVGRNAVGERFSYSSGKTAAAGGS